MSQFIEEYYVEKKYLQQLRPHVMVIRGVSYKPSDIKEKGGLNSVILLRSNNIDNGRINFDDVVNVDSDRVSENQVLQHGDIVMCGSNGSKKLVGKAAMIDVMPENRCSFGAFCLGIRCKKTIHPKFLSTFFQTSIYREVIESLGAGSNILNIKPDHIYDLMVPVPPLDKQQMFVSIVEQADKSEFDGFKSQFIEMFKEDYPMQNWEDCLSITNGKRYDDEYQESGLYPICGSAGVMGFGNKKLCDKDTVILGRKGNINSPIYMEQDYWIVDTAFSLAVDRQKLQPKYFFYWCKQFDFMQYNKQGVLPSLTKNDLLKIELPIPPIELQNKFVSILEQADKSENHCEFRMAS